MEYRQLGRSGLKISPICLGTMMFGGPTDEATSTRIVAKAREAGVNFIDTADAYTGGNSEQVVGRAISNNRHNWMLATKLANQIGRRSQPRRAVAALGAAGRRRKPEAARHRLHRHLLPAQGRPFDAAGRDGARDGRPDPPGQGALFRRLELPRWRVAEICNICDRLGIDRPIVSQPYYNAMNRMPEVELFPACGYYGLGVVPYSPLARGVLTGKYRPDAAPDKDTPRRPQRHAA